MAKKGCQSSYSDRCDVTVSTDCVDYQGFLRENTSIDEKDCYTLTDVIEDLTLAVDQLEEELDFSDFESCCIDFEPSDSDKGLTVKDVISTLSSVVCEYIQKGEKVKDDDCGCNKCDDGCEENSCCVILKKFESNTSVINITSNSWVKNNTLSYKADKEGTYEVILELVEDIETTNTNKALIGISLDSFDPENSIFSQVTISPRHPKTIHFITKMIPTSTVRVAFKKTDNNYKLEYVKMIVKKIK